MIVEENGLILMPGNGGADCPANGLGVTSSGEHIECCCDECDYGMCCYAPWYGNPCEECDDVFCPRSPCCDEQRKEK